METWYHIGRTPGDLVYVHRQNPMTALAAAQALVADDPELSEAEAMSEVREDFALACRSALGFPVRGRWVGRAGWDSSLSPGEPHPSVMTARANPDIDTIVKVA